MSKNIRKREFTSEELQRLPVEEAVLYILELPPEKRVSLLEELDNAQEIVDKFPPQEVFYTIKEADEDQVRYLLPLLNKEQFIFLIDMELWEKDRLSQPKIKLWLDRIASLPFEEITRRIKEMEPELVEAIFRKTMFIKLKPTHQEKDIMEAMDELPPYTLDGVFYFNYQDPEIKSYMEKILGALYSEDIEYVLSLLLEATYTTTSEVEEASYQFRTARLKDYMIPELDEAVDIYLPLPEDILKELKAKRKEKGEKNLGIFFYDESEAHYVRTPMALCKREEPFLSKIIDRITDGAQLNRIVVELTRCMYKTIVADLKPIDQLNSHKESARKVSYHINLALKLLAKTEEEAKELLLRYHLSYLLRYANQEINKYHLKAWRIKKGSWLAKHPKAELLIDEPWGKVLKAITNFRPYFPASVWNEGEDRPFRDPEDLLRVNYALELIELMGELLKTFISITPEEVFNLDFKNTNFEDIRFVNIGLLFRTAIANWFIEGLSSPIPLKPKDIRKLANIISIKHKDSITNEIIEEIKGKSQLLTEEKLHILKDYIYCNIEAIKEELEPLKDKTEIEPKFIHSLLVQRD